MNRTVGFKARHVVLSILFGTWIVSTMDRMAMSVALPYISGDFQLTPVESGFLLSAFFAGYSISHIPGGFLADRFGARKVAAVAMLWWSVFTAMTGFAANLVQMVVARVVFGLGEGVFPACAFKTVAVWFPKEERATANAVMLASNPLGLALSPLAVVGVMSIWGWRAVFFSLFIPGILIAVLFWIVVRNKPSESRHVSPQELDEIESGDVLAEVSEKAGVNLMAILKEPNIVKFFLVLFAFDVAFWGFTAWLPTYLVKARGFSMTQMGVVASLPFFSGTIGSVAGGWVSDRYFSANRRLPILLAEASSALFLYMTFTATSMTALIVAQTLAGFFLMSFFSAFWALPMNSIPKHLMGVASGFINMAGQISAFLSPLSLGYLVQAMGGDFGTTFLFLIAALAVSSSIVFTISPRPRSDRKEIAAG